jgi:hypothetical protein
MVQIGTTWTCRCKGFLVSATSSTLDAVCCVQYCYRRRPSAQSRKLSQESGPPTNKLFSPCELSSTRTVGTIAQCRSNKSSNTYNLTNNEKTSCNNLSQQCEYYEPQTRISRINKDRLGSSEPQFHVVFLQPRLHIIEGHLLGEVFRKVIRPRVPNMGKVQLADNVSAEWQ